MAIVNQHINEFLDYYIDLDDPQYAILLSGKWGSGKTFHINQIIEKYQNTKNIVKVSLFGLKSKEDIHKKVLLKLFNIDDTHDVSVTAKLVGQVLKKFTGINLSDMPMGWALKQEGNQNAIFIFDDLERAEIGLIELHGYINELTEIYKQKVILLADEDKLKEDENYILFKEKTIGKTFAIEQNFETAFETFLQELKNSKDILSRNQSVIKAVFGTAGYQNLRSLRQTMLDFDHLINNFESKFKEHLELMSEIIQIFFAFSLEIKSNRLDINTLAILSELRIERMHLDEKNDSIETEIEKVYRKYDFINFDSLLFPNALWIELFSKYFITSQQITESLNKSRYFFREERESWINLWHYLDLEEEEFQNTLSEMLEKLQKNEYLEPEKCMHITGILLRLEARLLYISTSEQIVSDMKSYIDRNTKNWIDLDIVDEYRIDTAPYGLGYMNEETSEFQEVKIYLLSKAKEAIYGGLSEQANMLIECLNKKDIGTFVDLLSANSRRSILYRLPVFQSMSPDEFFKTLINIENKYFRDVSRFLIKRYETVHFEEHTPLLDELDFWKRLYKIVKTYIESNHVNIKTVWLGYFSEHIEKQIIQKIEKQLLQIEKEKNYVE